MLHGVCALFPHSLLPLHKVVSVLFYASSRPCAWRLLHTCKLWLGSVFPWQQLSAFFFASRVTAVHTHKHTYTLSLCAQSPELLRRAKNGLVCPCRVIAFPLSQNLWLQLKIYCVIFEGRPPSTTPGFFYGGGGIG